MKISVIVPCYNEEEVLGIFYKEMKKVMEQMKGVSFEILFIDDGSRDRTLKILKELSKKDIRCRYFSFSRNFGKEAAMYAGFQNATGDYVAVMDADLQDPPSLIPEMITKWENGADIVVGSRVKRSNDNFFKKFGANCYYKVLDSLSGKLKLEKSAANFRLLSRKALNQVLELPEVNSVFRVVVPFVGMKTDIVEYDRDKRFAGKTKYNLKSMIPYALNSITGISVEPLRKIVYMIPLMLILFVASTLGIIFSTGIWKTVCLLLMNISIIGGFLFLALSIMAEYLAQIMIEVKGRPISIIYDYKPCENVERRQE